MEPKTIVAIVLVAFIIGGFIFLQVRKKNKNGCKQKEKVQQIIEQCDPRPDGG